MAKFCGNCGTKLGDSAKICSQCGTPVESNAKVLPVKIVDQEKQKKNKKILKTVAVVILAIVLIITAVKIVPKFTGYNNLLKKVMKAYEAYDIDSLVALSSDVYYYGEDGEAEEYFDEHVGWELEGFENQLGANYEFSYKINETYEMQEYNKRKRLEEIEYYYPDFDISIIQKIVVANTTVTAKKDDMKVNIDVNIIMTKEKGAWKLLYIE
ncbi:MAG: zinc-ribbon domain-containing protein [Blautia sp.]|nr:zinc-ribbon domain-containing protein [Blautia sp.]